jgi:hypothetical protein
MEEADEHEPGEAAPYTGHYEELNVFGTQPAECITFKLPNRCQRRRAGSCGGVSGEWCASADGKGERIRELRPLDSARKQRRNRLRCATR